MSSLNNTNYFAPMTPQEEKEVHRVFELLADYSITSKLRQQIDQLKAYIDSNKNLPEANHEELLAVTTRKANLEKELEAVHNKPDKKIGPNDLTEMFKFLNYKIHKRDIEEMIWEVDENLDGYLDLAEFKLMYNRNITDKTGLEPSRMVSLSFFII